MVLVDNIMQLCKRNHTSFYEVERSVGLGNGVIGKWRNVSPRIDSIKKVADFFGVTVDDLLKDDSTESPVR